MSLEPPVLDRDHDDVQDNKTAQDQRYGFWHLLADVLFTIPELLCWLVLGLFRIVAMIFIAIAGS